MLGTLGYRADHPSVARALDYLWHTQEPEGCWYGRWGVNYIYGTWQVLQGLKAIDFPMDHPACPAGGPMARVGPAGPRRLGRDLRELRRPIVEGGRRRRLRRRRPGPSSGLIAAGRAWLAAVRRGIEYLLETQLPDGTWDEPMEPDFPVSSTSGYHLYRVYFPLMAMARYQTAIERRLGQSTPALACRIPARQTLVAGIMIGMPAINEACGRGRAGLRGEG